MKDVSSEGLDLKKAQAVALFNEQGCDWAAA
jgi:hypothetical protein